MKRTARNSAIVAAAAAAMVGSVAGGSLSVGAQGSSGDLSVVAHGSIWSSGSDVVASDTAGAGEVAVPTQGIVIG